MDCPQCATENPESAKFCMECATPLGVACAQCGTELPIGAKFCFNCATPVDVSPKGAQPPEQDAIAARLQRLVPPEFGERLVATRGQASQERRIVTILFSDVKGSTAMAEHLDPEEWVEIMQGAFDLLIEPVYRYEGTVARLMGDAIVAFFGAPIAHEDDAQRAVLAALDIIAGAREYATRLEQERGIAGFNVRVGINTGLVVVGEVGSDLRMEYTAMGDAVNVAARMEQNAPPGAVLITDDTYRQVRGVFDVSPQEPLAVKGKAEPVQTYLVEGAKPRAFRKPLRGVEGIETRMVGREAELKHLQEAFYAVMEDGELQQVTISGEAGVGKSRLLHEFDIWAEALPEQYYYFRGRAFPGMRNQPYAQIRDLIAFRFQIQDSDTAAGVREKLEEGVGLALGDGENSRAAGHLIGHLIGFEISDSPHLAGVRDDPQQLRDQALARLAGYFRAMAGQFPVLILLEDLHWADDSSLDALNHLAQALTGHPLMVVGAARPELFERRPHWGEGQPFHTRLDLQRLSKWDSRRLVAEILQKVGEVPQSLRDLVVSGAEGNPFFIEELIKMLVEDGVIIKGEERWRLEPLRLRDVRVPPTLTGVLQARVDRLPAEERTVLQQASVVGRLFWDRAVARINASAGDGIEEAEIQNNLSALRRREMVFQRETSAFAEAQEYLFKHNMLREVTYKSVLKRLRRVYHGLVADWLLEQSGERLEEYTALIADHLELAGRTAEAVGYLLQAGDRARGLYAHQEAIGAYERVLALLKAQGDDRRAARTLMKLGLTHHNAFAFGRSRQAYEEGFALWQRSSQAQPAVPLPPAPHALREARPAPSTLDPGLSTDNTSGAVIGQLFSGLVETSPEMDVVPDVANSWEVLEGGRKYVFHLRDDVYWSDGVAVTAADFEYAWKRVLDPGSQPHPAHLLYDIQGARAFHQGQVATWKQVGVHALDDLTLVVELEGPTGYFPYLLTYTTTLPVPQHVVQSCGAAWTEPDHLVTNGPFRLVAWEQGKSMLFERNPTYHGRLAGNLLQVELSFRAGEPARLLQMYEENHLETFSLNLLPQAERDRCQQRYAGEYVSIPSLWTTFVGFDTKRPPFSDVRVRRAFALATDRETLVDTTLSGYWLPAKGGLIPPGMPGHSPGIGLPYDPERARHLLAEAGYPQGGGRDFPALDALALQMPIAFSVVEYLQAEWLENLGIEITWRTMELGKVLDRVDRKTPHIWYTGGWAADYPDPDSFLRAARWRVRGGWQNRAYDELVEGARRVMDQDERMRMYQQADRILTEEAPLLLLCYGGTHLLVKPWVTKYPTSGLKDWLWKDVILEPH